MAIRRLSASYIATILNGLIPLTVIPVISKNSGLEVLGQVFVAIALVGVGQLLVDYGFNFSAMRAHAEAKESLPTESASGKVLLEVSACKLLLLVILGVASSFLVYLPMPEHLVHAREWLLLGGAISLVNFSWLFFSLEISLSYSLCMLATRILLCIPILVGKPEAIETSLLLVLPQVITNIAILTANRKRVTVASHLDWRHLNFRSQYRSGLTIYVTTLISSISAYIWPLMMGFFITKREMGVYIVGDRIFRGMMSFATPIPNFVIAAKAGSNPGNLLSKLRGSFKIIFFPLATIFCQIVFLVIPDSAFRWALGDEVAGYENILRLYSFGFWFGILNLSYYTWAIINKTEHVFTVCYIVAALIATATAIGLDVVLYLPLISEAVLAILCIGHLLYTFRWPARTEGRTSNS